MKRFALRGTVVLAIVVCLCMFFAGTVRTITTPKVKLISAKQGKLEQTVSLKGKLTFSATEDLRVQGARKYSMVVDSVNVRPGYEIKKGDVLMTLSMADHEEKEEKLRADFLEQLKKLDDLDVKNRELSRSNSRNDAYEAMLGAHEAMYEAKFALRARSIQEGKDLLSADVKLSELSGYARAQGGSQWLIQAAKAYSDAHSDATKAENKLFDMLNNKKTKGKEGVWNYLKERMVIVKEMAKLEDQMAELALDKANLSTVRAARDGYVVSVAAKPGDACDGKTASMVLNQENTAPVLRADASEVRQTIAVDSAVSIKFDYDALETKVCALGIDSEGKKYVDVEITPELIQRKGGLYSLTLADTDMTVTFRAAESATLVPASAIRSKGENENFIYVVRQEYGGFTGSRLVAQETPVTVITRGDKVVSVAEDLYDAKIADKEDRAIKDGDTVMEYVT